MLEINIADKISWSSLSLFERSVPMWIDRYIHGVHQEDTPQTIFGKYFHKSVEQSDFWHPHVKEVREAVDGVAEKEFLVKVSGIFLHGFLDWYTPGHIYEIKTGAAWWTQRSVDRHGQLDFYALAMEMLGTPVNDFTLISVRTKKDDGIVLDDKPVRVINRTITDLQPIWERIRKYHAETTVIRNQLCHDRN